MLSSGCVTQTGQFSPIANRDCSRPGCHWEQEKIRCLIRPVLPICLPVLGKRFFSSSVESLQQFVPVALESFSQPARDLKRGAGTAILDSLEIGPVNLGLSAKLLLRHPQVGAETADVLTKLFAN